jgi:hypothetical protein
MITMLRSGFLFIGVLLTLFFVIGCHTPLAVKQMQAKNPWAKNVAKTPVEIFDIWSTSAQTTADGRTLRGMAGRIYFYDSQAKGQTVKVDGDLTVFVFDGSETDPAHAKPLKVFRFTADTLQQHYSHQKPLGHGYNVFLPMDEIGGEERPLCIMVRFDDRLNEMLVMAQPSNTILAGRKPQPPTESTIREFLESRSLLAEANRSLTAQYDSAIQQAGYITEEKSAAPEKSRVSTISLNSEMTRRLLESAQTSER